LKINIEKTSAVWIGSKKGSSDVLCKDYKMNWVGDQYFSYLGVTLCTNLNDIVNVNYNTTMQAIAKQIHHWSKRFLTVLGRIVVVKTLLLPKLNHLVLSLPTPDDSFISDINSKFYHFIWGGKTDRISRNQMALASNRGGTSMVQFESFAKALKITWIRRLFMYDNNNKVYNLFKVNIPNCNFDYSSHCYWKNIIDNCHNMFWKNVISAWMDLTLLIAPKNREQVLSSSIWHNDNIKVGHKSVLYVNWDKHGIKYVNDLVAPDGEFLSLYDIQNKFDVKINFLHYYGIKQAISKSFSNLLKNSSTILQNPYQGLNTSIILKNSKGCKLFYNILINEKKVLFKCMVKWNNLLNVDFEVQDWVRMCHYNWKCTQEVKLRWFQFRLLNRILCTNKLLVKIGKSDNTLCTFCNNVDESISHLLWDCEYTLKYWKEFQDWMNSNLTSNISLNKEMILFGNYKFKDHVFNNMLLVLKFNIYKSRVKKEKPSFTFGKKDLHFFSSRKDLCIMLISKTKLSTSDGIGGNRFLKNSAI